MLGLLVVLLKTPGSYRLSMKNKDMKEGVQEEDAIRGNTAGIEKNGSGRPIERVCSERGLDHNQGILCIFSIQLITVI